jgi:hypothetical protein
MTNKTGYLMATIHTYRYFIQRKTQKIDYKED